MNVQIDYALIGQRIRDLRQQAHLTQAELAERSGVCQQYIGSLERGKGIPSLCTVLSLCSALTVDPNALLLGAARYDPDAPSTLRDIPSLYHQTLTKRWAEAVSSGELPPVSFDASAFPSFDLTLENGEDASDSCTG